MVEALSAMDRLAAMETFVQVVDAGSLSAAARQLKVGQSSVSKSVAQLEEWLGVRLLLRSTRSLTITEAGQRFYERAKRTIQEATDAEAAARESAAGLSGKLRVSASICFARIHILPRLPELLTSHPDLDLEIILDDRIVDLVKEGVDVALRTAPLTDGSLTTRKIAQSRRLVMASGAYLDSKGTPQSPSELARHQIVNLTRAPPNSSVTFRKGSSEVAVTVGGQLRVTTSEGLREAVLAGLGFAIVSEWLFTPEIITGAVRTVLDDWSLPVQDLAAVYATGRRPTAKAHAFVAFVERCLKEEATAGKSPNRLTVRRAS
jgi:DNA-binding transcriptional LysR family regulator